MIEGLDGRHARIRPMLLATPSETQRWLLDIADATAVASCGGKAVGLAKLKQAGWPVPAAICEDIECRS